MAKRILVPLDYSDITAELVKAADEWGQQFAAELFFVHVGYSALQLSEFPTELDSDGQQQQLFLDYLNKIGVSTKHSFEFRTGVSYQEILAAAEEIQADLIIIGAHDHSLLGRLFLGSNTDYIVHHATCPVYVYKQHPTPLENKIIVPLDYTGINQPVIHFADQQAQQNDAELYFIHVESYPEFSYYNMESGWDQEAYRQASHLDEEERGEEMSKYQLKLHEYIEKLGVKAKHQVVHQFGKPYLKICDLQKQINARLIMIAAHSHTLVDRILTGSNTDYLLHHANCPMYIYKSAKI